MDQLNDLRAVGERVVKPAMVAIATPPFAKVGEVEAAPTVEYQVVRRRQFVAVALAIENARLAAAWINALDISALVILGRPGREKPALRVFVAAIVADINSTIGAAGDPVRPAAWRPDRSLRTVGRDPGDRTAGDLAQDHRAVGHRHRPLREPQPRRHDPNFRHRALLTLPVSGEYCRRPRPRASRASQSGITPASPLG